MKISIVTVSFNQRVFLKEAIESVLHQGYPDLEYIVVDPGSTDGSRELIQEYAGQITATILEPDCGAADGLNKGFARATGNVLGFLNSDDMLLPGALAKVAEQFLQAPDVDIVMGNGYIVDSAGRRRRYIRARNFTVRRYLYGGCRWLQQATFFRRQAFLQTSGFNVANRTCWDGELLVSMAADGAKVGYVDKDLAYFRVYSSSISGSGSNATKYKEDCRRIFHDVTGKEWRFSDEVMRTMYRVEGYVLDRWPVTRTGTDRAEP